MQAACLLMTGGAVMLPAAQETAMLASAADYTEEEYEGFTIRKYETYVEIVKYKGSQTEVTVPDYIDELPVLSLADDVFNSYVFPDGSSNSTILSMTLPKTLLNIGKNVFHGCTKLETIAIPDSVTVIGEGVFSGCKALNSVQLSKKLKKIPDSAFESCISLTGIGIPEKVTAIGGSAFKGCTALKEISLPDCCTAVGERAFMNCTNLKEIVLPGNVAALEAQAFKDCARLERVIVLNPQCTFPESENPDTICNFTLNGTSYYTGAICSYENSAAKQYAEENELEFISLGAVPPATTAPAVTTSPAVTTTKTVTTTTAPVTTTKTVTASSAPVTTTKAAVTTVTVPASTKPADTTVTAKPAVTTNAAASTAKPVTTAPAPTAPVTTTTKNPYTSYITGDVNGDGQISVDDAQLALKEYTEVLSGKKGVLSAKQRDAADIDANGKVTVEDVQIILKYYTERYVAGKKIDWADLLK
ncbi:MAG: leucine-rich repeat protein [Oscillospiraceae bacterium]|nr:leucine-rich repeat protein [Oscillospiraceae bacterium]